MTSDRMPLPLSLRCIGGLPKSPWRNRIQALREVEWVTDDSTKNLSIPLLPMIPRGLLRRNSAIDRCAGCTVRLLMMTREPHIPSISER